MSCILEALSSNGSLEDVLINYPVCGMSTFAIWWVTNDLPDSTIARFPPSSPRWYWAAVTFVVFALQIITDCSTGNFGISVVYCTHAGMLALLVKRFDSRLFTVDELWVAWMAVVIVVAVVLYYAFILPILDSMAHVVGWILGVACGSFYSMVLSTGVWRIIDEESLS